MGVFDDQPLNLTPDKPLAAPKPTAAPAAPAPEAKPAEKPGADVFSSIGKGQEIASKQVDALEAEKMKLNPPTINLPPKPEPKHTSPIEQWGSFAMMFAALGGMMSRNHMTTALNAATAVLNGFKEGDTKASEQALKEWESANKTAIQLYDFQNRAYEQALGRIDKSEGLAIKRGSEDDKVAAAKINALVHAFGDVAGIEAYQRGGVAGFEEHQKKLADATEQLKEQSAAAGLQGAEKLATLKLTQSQEWKDAANDPMKQRDMALKAYHDVHDKPLAAKDKDKPAPNPDLMEKLRKFEVDPPSGYTRKYDPELAASYDELRKTDKSYDPNMAKTVAAARIELTKGKTGQSLTALGTAYDHLSYLKFLAHSLPNGSDMQQANALAANISKQFGHPEVTTFETARAIVTPEIVKALVNGQGGSEERKEMQEKFATPFTRGQIDSSIESARFLLGEKAENLLQGQLRAAVDGAPEVMAKYVNPKVVAEYKANHDRVKAQMDEADKADEIASGKKPKAETFMVEKTDDSLRKALALPDGAQVKLPNGVTHDIKDLRPTFQKWLATEGQ